jgi:hypothetical protein
MGALNTFHVSPQTSRMPGQKRFVRPLHFFLLSYFAKLVLSPFIDKSCLSLPYSTIQEKLQRLAENRPGFVLSLKKEIN